MAPSKKKETSKFRRDSPKTRDRHSSAKGFRSQDTLNDVV